MKGLEVGENQYEMSIVIPNHKSKRLMTAGQPNGGLPRVTIDYTEPNEHRTIIRAAKTQQRAVEMGRKIWVVESCHKIDPYYSLYKIEHLNLNQHIEVAVESYEFNENGEITIDKR